MRLNGKSRVSTGFVVSAAVTGLVIAGAAGVALAGGGDDPMPSHALDSSEHAEHMASDEHGEHMDGGEHAEHMDGEHSEHMDGAHAEHADMQVKTLSFDLTGAAIPDGKGSTVGSGMAKLTLDPNAETVCYDITWEGLEGVVTAIHLHEGPAGGSGGHAVDLFNDEYFTGEDNHVMGCVDAIDPALLGGHAGHGGGHEGHDSDADAHEGHGEHDDHSYGMATLMEVLADPAGFYLNIHTDMFDKGALRGQLA